MPQKPRRSAGSHALLAITVAVLAGTFALPASAQTAPQPVAVGGDCEADRYKALLQTGFAAMGDAEYPYFLTLDARCRTHKRTMAQAVAGSAGAFNPCLHPPYASLLAGKAPTDMTQREYTYFSVVDRECAAYKAAQQTPAPPDADEEYVPPSSGRRWFTGLAVLGSLVAMLLASL